MAMDQTTRTRRGLALILVIGAIALGAVLGYAMLATASLQSHVTHNLCESAETDALAESGLNLAIYYLQNPYYAPQLVNGYWPGTGGPIALGSGVDGQIDVGVTRDPINTWLYAITSSGRSGSGAAGLSRATSAQVYLQSEFRTPYAAVFSTDVTLPVNSSITGNVFGANNVSLRSPFTLNGTVYARGSTTGSPYSPLPAQRMYLPVNLAEIRDYRTYDANGDGIMETALSVTADTTVAAGTTLGPTAGNPSGVRYYGGNLTLNSNVVVNGTLVVKGTLTIAGTNVRVHRLQAGLPAVLVEGTLFMSNSTNTDLTVEGLCWVGGKVDAGLFNRPRLIVQGSLLVNGSNPVFYRTPGATVTLTNVPENAYAPDLTEKGRTVLAVKVLSWGGSQ
jgi:hypothetical protein